MDLAFPLASAPRFFLRVPAFLYDIFFAFPCAPSFLFRVPSVRYVLGWGSNSSHARCVCVDGSGGRGQLATAPLLPSLHVCGVRVYWQEAGLGSNSCLVHNPPLPPLLSVYVITVLSLKRNANLAFLFFRACVPTFPFPRSRSHVPVPTFLK